MTNKDFLRKALAKLNLAGEDRLPAAPQPPDGAAAEEISRLRELELLAGELKNKELLITELQNALDKRETERGRAEIELAGKASDFKSAVSREREDYKTRCEKLEKEFSAAEKTLISEVELLREAVTRKDADLDRLSLDLKSARDLRKTEKDEAGGLAARIRELEEALKRAAFSLEEKNKRLDTAVKALERVKKEAEGNFEKLSSREKDLNKLKTSLESAKAGVENLRADLAARERELTAMEKARLKEPNALKDALARIELENIRLKKDLAESLEKTALFKGESEARKLELQDVNVFNKSAISALREKDEEIRSLDDRLKTAQKDLEAAAIRQGELESLGEGAAKLSAELKKLEQVRDHDVNALQQARDRDIGALEHARNRDVAGLERELNGKDLTIAELQSRIEALKAAREHGERLVAKAEELRAAISRERAENAADQDKADQETAAREKALLSELQIHKEAAAHKDAVAESLRVELAGVRASHDSSRKELNAALASVIELEKFRDGADKAAAEITKLRETHSRELAARESELGDKDRVLSSFNSESARARDDYKRLELELAKKDAELNAAIVKEREEQNAHSDRLEKEFSSREKALLTELQALKERDAHKAAGLDRLGIELKSARELREADRKELESRAAELGKLASLKDGAARHAGELRKLEEARSRDRRAFELELETRKELIASLNGELPALHAELAQARRELAGKTAEFKTVLTKESKDQQAARDKLEKDFAAREKALSGELQALKEAAGRAEAEINKLKPELESIRAKREADRKTLESYAAISGELEKVRGDAERKGTELESLRAKREADRKIVESYAAISGELEKTRADAERKGSELARLNMDLKNLRERRDEDSKRIQFYSVRLQDLEKLREEAADKTSALAKVTAEANILREIREADRKALESYPAKMAELENFRGESARLAFELKNAQENRAHEVKALELELKNKAQAVAALQSDLYKRQEDRERTERELAEKSAGFKTQLNSEREEYRTHCAELEKEFSSREKTFLAELQSAKELSADREKALAAELQAAGELTGRKETEAGKLSIELKGVQDKYAEALREDFTANYDILEKDFAAREKTLVAALKSLEETAGRQEAELDALNLELKAIREKYAAAAREIESSNDTIIELEKLKDDAEEAAGEIKKLKENHAGEISELRQELAGRNQALAALNAESARREEERRHTEAELTGKGAEFKTQLNGEREEYRARCDKMEKEFSSREKTLIIELQNAKEAAGSKEAETGKLRSELKNLREKHETAGKTLESSAAKIGELERSRDEAARLAAETQNQAQDRAHAVKALELELKNKTQAVAGLQAELYKRQEERTRAELELAAGKADFKSLLYKEREEYRTRHDSLEQEFSAREKALITELQTVKELAARGETELNKLSLELKGARDKYEAGAKESKASGEKIIELEKLKDDDARLSSEIKKMKDLHTRELTALELELSNKDQVISSFNSESEKRREEHKRLELELAGKGTELKSLLKQEREEHRTRCDSLEKEFSAKEKALISELQGVKKFSDRREAEHERLGLELQGVREQQEAGAEALRVAHDRLIELEKLKGGAARYSNEIKKLKELHAKEITALESELNNKEHLISSFDSESAKRREERHHLEKELAEKSAEFKALLNREREAYRADHDGLEKDFSAREQAFITQVRGLNETVACGEAELDGLAAELSGLREKHEAATKELESRQAKQAELEKFRGEAARLEREIKSLEQARAHDVKALELELNNKTQAVAALQSELYKRQEERERAGQELAGKSAEFKSVLNKEREEYSARCTDLEKEFSAREKTFITELQGLKGSVSRKDAELAGLTMELKSIREKCEAARKTLESHAALSGELERAKDEAERKELELARLTPELNSLREKYEAARKALEIYPSKLGELEKSRGEAARLAGIIKDLEQERGRAGLELAGKTAEFKSLLNKEREEYKARCDRMEKEFSSREKAFIDELQDLKEAAARKAAELERLAPELNGLRGKREEDRKALEASTALSGELETLKTEDERKGRELARLVPELTSLREKREEDRKTLESLPAKAAELEKSRAETARLSARIKELEQSRAGDIGALELELAGAKSGFKSLLDKERGEFRAKLDRLEKEYAAGEKALLAEVQSAKEAAARRETEAGKLRLEQESARAGQEAARKELASFRDRLAEMEKLRAGAEKYAGEMKKLKEMHRQEMKSLELELNNKEQLITSLSGERAKHRQERERLELELGELEKTKAEAARLSAELKNLEQTRAHDVKALELELKNKAQAAAGLQAELYKRQEERTRAELELAENKSGFKTLLDRERGEFRAERDRLEAESAAALKELGKLREAAERGDAELARLKTELENLRGKREADRKALEAYAALPDELEKLKDGAERSAGEIKKLRESNAKETAALARELDARDRVISSLNAESAKRVEERKLAAGELAAKSAEFKALLDRERGELAARCDRLEKEAAAREKALLAELQGLKEAGGRKNAETDRLAAELKSAQAGHEAGRKELAASRGRILELEKLKGGAEKYADELKKLKELHGQELKAAESALNGKEQLIASLNAERIKRQEECARLELELAAKAADFKSLLNREREAARAERDSLEKGFSARAAALAAELQRLREAAGGRDTDVARLNHELKTAGNLREAGAKALASAAARINELEGLRSAAESSLDEAKQAEELLGQKLRTLEGGLDGKERAVSGLRGELAKLREEHKRVEAGLAAEIAEQKSRQNRTLEDFRTNYDSLERDFTGKEKALIDELQNLREAAGRKEAETAMLRAELEGLRASREAEREDSSSAEIKELAERHSAELKSLEAELDGKDRLIASFTSERVKQREELERLELELAGKESGLNSLLAREREAYRANYDALEKDFAARETALADELRGLKEATDRQEKELARLEKEFKAREKALLSELQTLKASARRRKGDQGPGQK